MLTRSSFLLLTLAVFVGIGLFRVKYEVIALEANHQRVQKEIRENQDAIHVLKAEWTYLNEPKSLQALCHKYLPELKSVNSRQLVTFQDMTSSPYPQTQSVHTLQPQAQHAQTPHVPAQEIEPSKPVDRYAETAPNSLDAYMDTVEAKEFSL